MQRSSLDFIDWMKCIGISLIVIGHVAGGFVNHLTPPIYPKQIGVAFFLFAAAFSLAQERRPRWRVVRSRLFEVYLFGVACAVLLTGLAYWTSGDLNKSNYLPFVGGANVLFNNFPANPTTWYIGTYLHFLLLWAVVLRRIVVKPWMLVVSVGGEIVVRAVLVATMGGFVGYMMFPNWISVFMLGTWYGQKPASERTGGLPMFLGAIAALAVAWAVLAPHLVAERTIPFMRLGSGPQSFTLGLMSACVSFLYLSYTWLVFQATSRASAPALIRFVARNTVIVFIAHMPLFYALETRLSHWTTNRALQVSIRLTLCLVALTVVSEIIRRVVRPKELRDRLFADRDRSLTAASRVWPPSGKAERLSTGDAG